ncbi:hypothetical protein EXM65_14355 [Clostridium botulinum]|uniref:DUF7210 domain-containing protein n=1 Tax=Clostridium botulinum TaxID=1491 RepID=A0A6M0SSG2_CLOBO|nr:hypothetical protein [Clostridium botulinum]
MEENTRYKAIAKQYIKYDGEHIKQGEEFEVKVNDVEELKQFADIEIFEQIENKNNYDIQENSNDNV